MKTKEPNLFVTFAMVAILVLIVSLSAYWEYLKMRATWIINYGQQESSQ